MPHSMKNKPIKKLEDLPPSLSLDGTKRIQDDDYIKYNRRGSNSSTIKNKDSDFLNRLNLNSTKNK